MNEGKRILLVEDDPHAAATLREMLEHAGYKVRWLHEANGALEILENDPPDLLLLDLELPGVHGEDLLHELDAAGAPDFPTVVVSGMRPEDAAVKMALSYPRVRGYVRKPALAAELLGTVDEALSG